MVANGRAGAKVGEIWLLKLGTASGAKKQIVRMPVPIRA
jgi:hypothetical protein